MQLYPDFISSIIFIKTVPKREDCLLNLYINSTCPLLPNFITVIIRSRLLKRQWFLSML